MRRKAKRYFPFQGSPVLCAAIKTLPGRPGSMPLGYKAAPELNVFMTSVSLIVGLAARGTLTFRDGIWIQSPLAIFSWLERDGNGCFGVVELTSSMSLSAFSAMGSWGWYWVLLNKLKITGATISDKLISPKMMRRDEMAASRKRRFGV